LKADPVGYRGTVVSRKWWKKESACPTLSESKLTEREDIPMKKGYHKGQELTMSELGLSLEEFAGQPLELFAQEGARLLLTVAMEVESLLYKGEESVPYLSLHLWLDVRE
jgi:hypothetical protein